MQEARFKSAALVDHIVPESPGLYCIRINNPLHFPKQYALHLTERGLNILYIGTATKSLKQRFLNQELRAIGHGTFFRSIGALLGFRPVKGFLVFKANKRNYTFDPSDKKEIINWVNVNLLVNWVEFTGNFGAIENTHICKYLPLINLDENPMALQTLFACRSDCVKH